MPAIDDPVTFVVPGDLHLTEPGLDNHRAALTIVDEINSLIRPDFVQFIGDNVQNATEAQFSLFDDIRQRLNSPHFALVGDHDVKDDPLAKGFRARFGDTFGSTSLRGIRFIRLDTQQAKPMGLWDAQVDWLTREVDEAIGLNESIVLFQHNYPYQIWESFDGPGVDAWRRVVQTRRVAAIICGHTHYWQVANDGRNAILAVRSVGDPEGGPPGYLVGHVGNGNFAVVFRSVEDRGPLVMITHPRELILATEPTHIVSGRDRIEARVWSTSAIERVDGRIDHGHWFSLEQFSIQCWNSSLSGERLSKGIHRLDIRAIDREGVEGRHSIEFAVDPTGRYTAIPRVFPVVESTSFC